MIGCFFRQAEVRMSDNHRENHQLLTWTKYPSNLSKPSHNAQTVFQSFQPATEMASYHSVTSASNIPYSHSKKCDVCQFVASSRGSLRVHMRTHTGEKPFHCPHCNLATNVRSNMRRHIRTVHPNEDCNIITSASLCV